MNLFQSLLVHFNWSLCFPLFLHLLIPSVTSVVFVLFCFFLFPFQKSPVVKGTSFYAAWAELIISFKGLIALSLCFSLVFNSHIFAYLVNGTAVCALVLPKTFLSILFCSAFCQSLKLLSFLFHI